MKSLSAVLLVTFLFLLGCNRQEVIPPSKAINKKAGKSEGVDPCNVAIDGKTTIQSKLKLIELGSIDLLNDATIQSLVAQQSASLQIGYDYGVTFEKLLVLCANRNIDLSGKMATSLINHGGNTTEATELVNSLSSFSVNGITLKPIIFFPFFDNTFFDQGNWDGATANFVSYLYSDQNEKMYGHNASGSYKSYSESQLMQIPTWFISIEKIICNDGGGSPQIMWGACHCEYQGISNGSPTYTCLPGDHAYGKCGRTGLFNNTCNGSCASRGGMQ